MRPLTGVLTATLLSLICAVSLSWSDHPVDNPKLERLPIWKTCCKERDCVPQKVKIVGEEGNQKIPVEIEGIRIKVDKVKFSPVPSGYTWVCYYDRNGEIRNRNIRCILHPQKSDTI